MNKQTVAIVVAAAILLGIGIFSAMAFTSSTSSGPHMMTMPDGSVMPATGGQHTMRDGTTMPGRNMNP